MRRAYKFRMRPTAGQHLRLQAAARGGIGNLVELVLQVAQRPQLFDGGRHEAGILQNPVRDTNFLGNEGVIVESGDPKQVLGKPKQARTKDFLSKVL